MRNGLILHIFTRRTSALEGQTTIARACPSG